MQERDAQDVGIERAGTVEPQVGAEGEPLPRLRSAIPAVQRSTTVPGRPGMEPDARGRGVLRRHLSRHVRRPEPPPDG